jgi:hypothetical protein
MQVLNKQVPIKAVLAALAALAIAIGFAACGETNASQKSEATTRQHSYDHLVKEEPAHTMEVSPTRKTINFWIDTWGHDPDKLSYVYLQAENGQLTGYYIFKGLPVSECAALTPNYELIDTPGDGDDVKNQQVPAPGVDGVYYSGGQCAVLYGRDATTNAFMEFSISGGQSFQLYDRPLPRQDVEPLGFTSIEEIKK